MEINSILIIFGVAVVAFSILYIVALFQGGKNIFSNSGAPINMANILLQSIISCGQILAGLAILAVLTFLIVNDKITAEVGLPLLTTLTSVLVVKSFDSHQIK